MRKLIMAMLVGMILTAPQAKAEPPKAQFMFVQVAEEMVPASPSTLVHEIDPAVERIARNRNLFSYVGDSRGRIDFVWRRHSSSLPTTSRRPCRS